MPSPPQHPKNQVQGDRPVQGHQTGTPAHPMTTTTVTTGANAPAKTGNTLAFGTMNCYSPLQANNSSLSVPQPQAHGLIRALASILLQRTPRPKHARGGLPQNEQKEKTIKHNIRTAK